MVGIVAVVALMSGVNSACIEPIETDINNGAANIAGEAYRDQAKLPPVLSSPDSDSAEVYCTDSDGGVKYYVAGVVEDLLKGKREDYCIEGADDILVEFHCAGGFWTGDAYVCPGICYSGACLLNILQNQSNKSME